MAELPDLSSHPRRDRWRVSEIVAVALAVFLLAGAARSAWQAEQAREIADSHLNAAQAEAARLRAEARGSGRTDAKRQSLVAPLLLSVDAPPAQVARDLAAHLPSGARVQAMVLRYEDQLAIDLDVVARDPDAWDRLLEELEASPRFTALQPGPERRDGEVRSSVSARYLPVPGGTR